MFVILCLYISTILLSYPIIKNSIEYKYYIIELYLKSYFFTALIGILFFIGYYKKIFSIQFISLFQIQVQKGAGGLLRISPGSYPNEYGTVSSFSLSIIILFLFNYKKLYNKKFIFKNDRDIIIYIMFCLITLVVLFLTTTRSAYLTFIISLIYIIFSHKKKIQALTYISLFFVFLYNLIQNFFYNIKKILLSGINEIFTQSVGTGARINAWNDGYLSFKDHVIFGTGFNSTGGTYIHNVYLQLLFELGIIGVFVLFCTFLLVKLLNNKYATYIEKVNYSYFIILTKIKNISIIHVLIFALTNHNLNHHLTWFCVLLILITNYKLNLKST